MSSSARTTHEYQPTIIESKLLIKRLAIQIAFFNYELKRGWTNFKRNPLAFFTCLIHSPVDSLGKVISTANGAGGVSVSFVLIMAIIGDRPTAKTENNIAGEKPE